MLHTIGMGFHLCRFPCLLDSIEIGLLIRWFQDPLDLIDLGIKFTWFQEFSSPRSLGQADIRFKNQSLRFIG